MEKGQQRAVINLADDQADKLDRAAHSLGVSRNAFIRSEALRAADERLKKVWTPIYRETEH